MEVNVVWLLLSTLGSAIVTYLTTYTNAKAKFQAELEMKARLTNEQEQVIAKYRLDHERRKYQYEKKNQVYSKYHNLLDEYDANKNPFLDRVKLNSILSEMLNKMKIDTSEASHMKAINEFSDEMGVMIRASFAGLKDIAKQTNELKLVAPVAVVEIVDLINANYDSIEKISDPIFADPIKLLTEQEDFSSITNEIERIQNETAEMKSKLILLMRKDIEII